MFDKERFHNALALSLGYERIVNDKRITIQVDDSNDPWVSLKFEGSLDVLRFKASDDVLNGEIKNMPVEQSDIQFIVETVHKAYQEVCNKKF
jgi:hypothetical protein